ncbi:hypothetical protein BDZ89DRAFT_1167031 [Hymenopellis radicata]|nr:hypothetical protein BDZ89DRAFT_1167031 [Hymenopellis radicata]
MPPSGEALVWACLAPVWAYLSLYYSRALASDTASNARAEWVAHVYLALVCAFFSLYGGALASMLIWDAVSNARGEEENTSGHFRDDIDIPAICIICNDISHVERSLYRDTFIFSLRVRQHVAYRQHPVLLEFRACCRSALFAADEAKLAAKTFLVHCKGTFSSSYRPGEPLNEVALESFKRLSAIVRQARAALPSTEARLDELGRLLLLELNGAPAYMSLLRVLQRTMGWGSRATLVDDLPILVNMTKRRIANLVYLLHELEMQIKLFHSAFQDSEWARHNPDNETFINAIVNSRNNPDNEKFIDAMVNVLIYFSRHQAMYHRLLVDD